LAIISVAVDVRDATTGERENDDGALPALTVSTMNKHVNQSNEAQIQPCFVDDKAADLINQR
jgi:hypothetical protein